MPDTKQITVYIYDGQRQLFPTGTNVLFNILNGVNEFLVKQHYAGPVTCFTLPFADGIADNLTINAWVQGYKTGGFTPLNIGKMSSPALRIMLLPDKYNFDFTDADWNTLQGNYPKVWRFLNESNTENPAVKQKYLSMISSNKKSMACFFNIVTAMDQIHLPGDSTVLDHMKRVDWEAMQQDRFFGWSDKELIDLIQQSGNLFQEEQSPGFFHPGSTRSWKQASYGEANVQLTFHEDPNTDPPLTGHPDWVRIEPDIDYYKDLAAHFFMEVAVNHFGKLTEPAQVYSLRWIAGIVAGNPPFQPPYTII